MLRRSKGLVLLALLAVVLAACGSGGEETPDETTTTSAGTDTTATTSAGGSDEEPSAEAPESATFVWAVEGVPANLDLAKHAGDPSRYIGFERNGTLFMYDTGELAGNGCDELAAVDQVRGELVESWERNEDGSVYTMTLREAVSPYGNTVTSADVAWTFERNIELSGVARLLYFGVATYAPDPITVIDDRTFELHVAAPSSMDLVVLTHYTVAIYDSTEAMKHATTDDPWAEDWLSKNTAEFGPFYMTEADFTPGSEAILTANPNYFGERGNIDRIVYRAIPDAAARLQLLEAGEVDLANRLTYGQYQRLETNESVNLRECLASAHDYVALNYGDPAFSNPLVRQAISMGINREELLAVAYQGYNTVSLGGLHRNFMPPGAESDVYEYNPDRARELLAEAGYPDGIDAVLTISPTRPGPEVDQTAVLLVNQLAAIGVRFQIKVIPGAEFTERTRAHQEQAWIGGGIPAIADAFYNTNISHTCTSAINTANYCNEELDALNIRLRDTPPGPERDALAVEMSQILARDLPVIELIDKTVLLAMSDSIDPDTQHFAPTQGLYVYTMTKR